MLTTAGTIPVTAAGVLSDGPVILAGVIIRNTHATNAGVFRIYDNATTNSGTILFTANLAAGAHIHLPLYITVNALKGLYLAISGSATAEGCVLIA